MTVTHCGCFIRRDHRVVFLPQVTVKTHATLFSSTSRTVLTQTFVNPLQDATLEEVNYAFPLYDGVSVVGFSCDVAGRTIKGVVKERELAKQEYDTAKENNKFAGLLQRSESSSDVFMTSLGNVPPGASIDVEITYLGELKHDAEVDGLRYTVPAIIAPRYGPHESFEEANNVAATDMNITVDAEMPSAIRSIQSPSHAVSVNIGTTSVEPDAHPSFNRASASLSLASTSLKTDFVLQIIADKLGEPSAIMETHPDYPNQRALMTTLVPKFGLSPQKPEIVFLCDRSGSMSGRIKDLISALRIFLKSLPTGVMFNICSFGSSYSFLWDNSVAYTEKSLNKAIRHVEDFSANMGGTEIHRPMERTFHNRYPDMELEVIMLTDGQISAQDRFFDLIRKEVASSKGNIRVFTLGVGSGASSSLIEGAARAGNGVAQSVSGDEKMDKKVIRTLKAALTPHITNYSLEIKYEKDDDDDFEIIETVMAKVSMDEAAEPSAPTEGSDQPEAVEAAPSSLFDPNYKEDLTPPEPPSAKDKYAHLPALSTPSYLQAPCSIPPLFAFNRTTVYVLLSESSPGKKAKSVVLRGTSKQGPLELEIEIKHLEKPGQTIHQLAARKAVQDLESNDGWLSAARRTSDNKLLKEATPSKFSGMVEKEAVRLGVKYQVSGKWCSFVAIDDTEEDTQLGDIQTPGAQYPNTQDNAVRRQLMSKPAVDLRDTSAPFVGHSFMRFSQRRLVRGSEQRSRNRDDGIRDRARASNVRSCSTRGSPSPPPRPAPAGALFGSAPLQPNTGAGSPGGTMAIGGSVSFDPCFVSSEPGLETMKENSIGVPDNVEMALDFGYEGGTPVSAIVEHTPGRSPAYSVTTPASPEADQKYVPSWKAEMQCATDQPLPDWSSDDDLAPTPPRKSSPQRKAKKQRLGLSATDVPMRLEDTLQALIALQSFAGNWSWSPDFKKWTGSREQDYMSLEWPGCSDHDVKGRVSATLCAIRYFKKHLAAEKEVWEMVVEKAGDYLLATTGHTVEDLEMVASQVE